MRVLIAEDDPVSRRVLELTLKGWGHECVVCEDGNEALKIFNEDNTPRLAILDWMMPNKDGLEVCRAIREEPELSSTYIIMLTAKNAKDDLVAGLRAGADDYITKPFDREELHARLNSALRVIKTEQALDSRVTELETALAQIEELHGLLPICAWCQKIRDDDGYWHELQTYLARRLNIEWTHGICEACMSKLEDEAQRDEEVR